MRPGARAVGQRRAVRDTMLVGGFAVILSACAAWRIEPTMPGPGVPLISNLRIEPARARVGQEVVLAFDFEDSDADLVEAHIYPSEVREWIFTQALNPTVLNLRASKYGQAIGSVSAAFKWETEGVRIFEVFVVDEQGHTSNKLRARITVGVR